jgi:hypothetical protein
VSTRIALSNKQFAFSKEERGSNFNGFHG